MQAAPLSESSPVRGEAIRVRGLVQGVGFRPAVWRLARELGLRGAVRNDAEGVLIELWGPRDTREHFVRRLEREAPPLARIDALERGPLSQRPPAGFRILESRGGEVHTGAVPDAATCSACLAEIRDAGARRHDYAFTNCTHCGPRLSILRRIPYDRAHTSMEAFAMCPSCRAEYDDPADRRFHAQPIACPDCGPQLWLEESDGRRVEDDPIAHARELLRAGRIIAVKGIGGFHLACDASNADAVATLRARKRREHKPFALMARCLDVIRRYCSLREAEIALLRSSAAPIVLLPMLRGARLAAAVAPGQRSYGFMLPYSPLHHLLLAQSDAPIVLTSGNRSDEPQCTDNEEARERLAGIADAWLMHDRDIVNRLDDSVVRMAAGAAVPLRRARGYAPAPLALPPGFAHAPQILALGGELKNCFCLLKDGGAILSQHLGDLKHGRAQAAFREGLTLYSRLFAHRPRAIAVDLHPDYLSSRHGQSLAEAEHLPLWGVQHHHAHVASCLADNGVPREAPPVLGMALDGLGYGADGTIWGGEVLLADYLDYRRVASLAVVPMPGGAAAIREPWRMAYAHLKRLDDGSRLLREYAALPFMQMLASKPLATLDAMLARRLNCPMTSSCGRLFDAVAAVCGLGQTVSYEGQAAIELEAAALPEASGGYPFALEEQHGLMRLEPAPMWRPLLEDLALGRPPGVVSARFHAGLAAALAALLEHLASGGGGIARRRVALCGGVFQNALLCELLIPRLQSAGWQVLRHARVPSNDGGLALGQATVAAARALAGVQPCA
jgi:hydrogenase maturation protein HypF